MSALIKTKLPDSNIYESICRIVADILIIEEAGQRALEPHDDGQPIWRVFVHRVNPIIHWDRDDANKCADVNPVINVTFDQSTARPGSSSNVNTISKQIQIYVDCYATGIGSDDIRADEMCGRDALMVAGKVEGILHSAPYAYLNQRGLIQARSIVTSESFQPEVNNRAVQRVRCVRHTLQVVAVYDTYQKDGELYDAGLVTVLDNETGEVRFGIEVPFTEPD